MVHGLIHPSAWRNIAALLLFVSLVSVAQGPKPIYTIEAKRNGSSLGAFTVELFPLSAPKHVRYFDSLVTIKFYDSLAFHRVVPAFVIQGGDPNSRNQPRETWGNGDPAQTNIPAEFTNIAYARGVLGAARDTDPNSANSQFFICVANAFSLNAQYTAYGRVLTGMNIVDTIVAAPRDANDNPFDKIIMFVSKTGADSSQPTVPVQLNPAPNAGRITLDSNLIWSSVAGAVLYRLDIATDSNFTNMVFSNEIGASSYKLTTVQLGLKKYFWRVSSNNGGYRSAFSPTRSFVTSVSIPTLVYPANSATNLPGNVTLKWSPVAGAVSYHVQVATNALFTQTALVFDQKGITDTVKQMTALQLSKKHYWRVAAETPDYEGAFGLQWNFTTGTNTAVREEGSVPSAFALHQNYPNPFNPATVIGVQLSAANHTTLTVFDALGRTVAVPVNHRMEAGYHSVPFDGSGLVSGIYFYRLISGPYSDTKKFMLMK
jgi:cyclophilin family peptidyl-prolyl cis-trans isomerase